MLNNLTSRNRKQKYTISDHKTIREDWPKDATLALSIWISCSCSGDDRGTEPASPWDRTKDKQRSMAEIRASQFAAIDRSLSPVPLPRRVTTAVLPKTHCCYCRVPPFSVLQTFFLRTGSSDLFMSQRILAGAKASETRNHFASSVFCLEPRNSPVHVRTRGEVDAHTWPFSTREAGDTSKGRGKRPDQMMKVAWKRASPLEHRTAAHLATRVFQENSCRNEDFVEGLCVNVTATRPPKWSQAAPSPCCPCHYSHTCNPTKKTTD
jgi:hypothetical protein